MLDHGRGALAFFTPARNLSKGQIQASLEALEAGLPDWHDDHEPPELRAGGGIAP
jgi:hypothetical protein